MPYKRPTISEKPPIDARRELLRDYIQHYTRVAEEDRELLNQKIPRETFSDVLGQIGEILLQQADEMAQDDPVVREFLDRNPVPASLGSFLPDNFRTFCLLLNALKQWLSAEQAATDRYFLAGDVRAELRKLATHCMVTGEPLTSDDIDLHHPVRDGRPPIPLSKDGHATIENQKKKQNP